MVDNVQNDVFRVTTRLNVVDAGDFCNVWYWRKTDIAPQSDASVMTDLSEILDEMYTTIQSHISDQATFEDINVFNVTQDRPLGTTTWPSLTFGGMSGDLLPAQTAAFVRGLSGYSRNWARKFLGPFAENQNSSVGKVSTGLHSALVVFAYTWLNWIYTSAGTWEPVVYHVKIHDYRKIIETALTFIWATIRRRRAGRGS